jgi:1-acyl-sn-glycerol-3-phosphate acyltransferase
MSMDAPTRMLSTTRTALRAARRTVQVFGTSTGLTALYGLVGLANGFDPSIAARWTRRWARAMTRSFELRLQVTGEPPTGGALLVSNHRSYVDIIALGSLVEACFIAKAEIARWPLLGATFRVSSTIFVDRGNPEVGRLVRQQITDRLRQGLSIINFSEGTTHGGTGLLPFKPGLFRTILGMDVPIVPTTVTYSGMEERVEWIGDDTFFDHFLRLAGHSDGTAHVHFAEPLQANDFATADELMAEVRRRMLLDLSPREAIDPADYPELA